MSRRAGLGSPGWTLAVGAAAVLAALYVRQEILAGGWAELQRYGFTEDGRNWAQLLPAAERRFYLALLWLLPLMVVVGWWARTSRRIDALQDLMRTRESTVVAVAAAVAAVAALCVGHLVLGTTPLTDDEWAYLHHAQIIAGGHWTAASPHFNDRVFYDNLFVINNGQWYSQYPVGNPLTLAPGVWLGDPWLVPALLCGGVVYLLGRASGELFGPGAGSAAAVLAATSPFLVASSGTLLAHVPCLFWLSLFLFSGLRATRPQGRSGWALLAAAAFGLGVLTRPVSTMLLGLPLLIVLGRRWWRAERPWRSIALFAAGGLVMVGVQLWINETCNGHPLRSAYFVYWLEPGQWRNPFGFGEFLWGIEHTPASAWGNLWHNAVRLDAWLLGWPVSLALPLAAVVVARQRRLEVVVLTVAALAPFALYFFFFWPGVADVGPVLYTESLIAWLPLTAAALTHGPESWRRFALGFALTGVVVASVTFHRVQLFELARTAEQAGAVVELAEGAAEGRRLLVFCEFAELSEEQRSWVVSRPNPRPGLDDDILYVKSVGPQRNYFFARNRHPDRIPYKIVRDPSCDMSIRTLEGEPMWAW